MPEATEDARELELDGLGERFFSQPPGAWEIPHDDWQPEPMSSLERVAMLTTAAPGMAMLAVALTLVCTEALLRPYAPPAVGDVNVHEPAPEVAPVATAVGLPPVVSAPAVEAAPPPVTVPPVVSAQPVVSAASVVAPPRRSAKRSVSTATRARQLLDAGRLADARDLAREAIRSAPSKAGGYIVLAAALDKLGDRAGMNATFRACTQHATDPLVSACTSLAR